MCMIDCHVPSCTYFPQNMYTFKKLENIQLFTFFLAATIQI